MERWEQAVWEFLTPYQQERWFLGAMVTGSYATGMQTENSDIDVIMLSSDTSWRERGNRRVGGYLIEYFINPACQLIKEIEEEPQSYHTSTSVMLTMGKILTDPRGELGKLVNFAAQSRRRPFEPLGDVGYKLSCYTVWDSYDELESAAKRGEDVTLYYVHWLDAITKARFCECRLGHIPASKLQRVLLDEAYRKKVGAKLPEEKFVHLLKACLQATDNRSRLAAAKQLQDYWQSKNAGFDIENFTLHSNL